VQEVSNEDTLAFDLTEHILLCYKSINKSKVNHQSTYNLLSLLQAVTTCFGLMNPSSGLCTKQHVKYNDMSTSSTFVAFFCGIPHNNYHYNKTVTVKVPSLRLKIIRNIIGNMKRE